MLPFAFFQPFHSNRIESTRRLVVESVGPFRNRLIYSSLRPTSSLKPPHIKSDQLDRKGELKASKRAAAHNLPLLGVSKNKSNGIESLVGNISSNMQSIGNEWKSWIPKRTNIENRTFNPPKDAYVNNQSPLKRITQFAFNTDGKLTGVKGNQPANIPRSFGQLQFKAKSLESGFVKNAVVLGKSVNNMQILSPSLAFSGLTLLESQRISKSTQQKQIEIEDIEEIDSAADEVLRDTFHEDKFLNSHNNQNNYKKTHSEVFDSRDLRDDILENLSNLPRETHLNSSILKNVNKQSKSVFDSSFKPNYSLGAAVVMKTSANEEVEITSGELRYQRYQESLRIDKIKFQNKVPIDRKSDNYREFIQSTHSKELHQQQPLSLGNKHIASESTYCKTQIEQSYVDRKAIECISEMKGDEKPKIDGTNSNGARYLDIVQLKNETAARLRQQQERNSPPFTERKSFTQKSDSRRAAKVQIKDNLTPKKISITNVQNMTASSCGRVQKSTVIKEVVVPAEGLSLRDLASKLSMKVTELRNRLEELGETLDAGLPNSIGENSRNSGEGKGRFSRLNQRRNKVRGESASEGDIHLDADVCELVVLELGLESTRVSKVKDLAEQVSPSVFARFQELENEVSSEASDTVQLISRAPVVCVMGHVDHGKTTLLDNLRNSNVAAGEAGGITQKLSAFSVNMQSKDMDKVKYRRVVFLDTPGHAAFSAMRSYGASATDLIVLVIAIDDGVRPQTIEAVKIALDSGCAVIVALNKVDQISGLTDRKTARARVLSQLVDLGIVVEDYGGETQVVEVSGRTGEGTAELVESLLLQADMMDLRAASEGQAEATVLDASMEKGRGVVADILVRWGSLRVGDPVVIGSTYGRVKAMTDDTGKEIQEAGPSTPVRLLGLRSVPSAGMELLSVESESIARQIAERRYRLAKLRLERDLLRNVTSTDGRNKTSLSLVSPSLKNRLAYAEANSASLITTHSGNMRCDGIIDTSSNRSDNGGIASQLKPIVVSVLIKADGIGTLDALRKVVTGLASRTDDVILQIADCAVGDITRSDIERASTVDQAFILGFNVSIADSVARSMAKELDVKIVRDTIIYRLEDELRTFMEQLMPKERILTSEGIAKVQQVFQLKGRQEATVAGLVVTNGSLKVGALTNNAFSVQYVYRIMRNRNVILGAEELLPVTLKRFKDTVYEVAQGFECALVLSEFTSYEEGDEIECYKVEWKTRQLNIEVGASGTVVSKNSNSTSGTNIKEEKYVHYKMTS